VLNPFAEIESLVNRGVESTLSNAVAVFDGGEPFGVVFDRKAVDALDLVEAAGPRASFDLRHAPGLRYDSLLLIDGAVWSVTGGLEPDASGWVTVSLREA
jgi:hypothetical protein